MYPRDLAMRDALDYEFLYNKRGGFFETVITALYRGVVREGDAVLDGGAHIGTHTGPLARCVGPSGKVVAVEALPHLAEKLREKFPWAKFPNVDIKSCAISSSPGSTSFNWVTNNEGYSGIRPRSYPSGSEIQQITVPVTTIDELLADEERKVTFMKLDLEGGEFCALLGARQVISKHCPIIVFENGLEWTRRFWDYTQEDFFRFFDEIGYDVYELFLRKLTAKEWRNPNRWPWDFIGVKQGSAAHDLVQETVYKFLLEAQRERSK